MAFLIQFHLRLLDTGFCSILNVHLSVCHKCGGENNKTQRGTKIFPFTFVLFFFLPYRLAVAMFCYDLCLSSYEFEFHTSASEKSKFNKTLRQDEVRMLES